MMTSKIAPYPTASFSPPEVPPGAAESSIVDDDLDKENSIGDALQGEEVVKSEGGNELVGERENDDSEGRVKDEETMENDQVEQEVAIENTTKEDDDVASPPRRGSILESFRRVSVDAAFEVGVHLGAIGPETEANPIIRSQTSIATIDNPVSFWHHTFTSNMQGLASALPSCVFILLMANVNDNLVNLGGFFGDMHVVRCFECLLYVDVMVLVLRWEFALTKRMLFCKCPGQITFMVAVSSAFGWKLGPWMNVVATLAFSFGEMCTYIMEEHPRPPMVKYMVQSLFIGFVIHGIIVSLINALVIPTRFLAKWGDATMTLVVTGIFFPFVIFLARRLVVNWLRKFVAGREVWSDEKKVGFLTTTGTIFSAMILITPSVLLYFNVSVEYALFSAFCQLFTEVGGKFWTVWAMKKRLTLFRKDDDNIDEELREQLALLAIRFHTEIVAEKGCIVAACAIAFIYFDEQVNSSSADLILIGVVFYVFELVADCTFVWLMHNMLGVPMLSAVPHSNLLSASNLRAQVVLILAFQAQANCIAMASTVEI
ncbi:hypothetical protein TrRE_jg7214 [Triparma retinervis]|uniref:Uncharacterized protein n=1 Tax=Triparma retinervis TaxID=2557542 RepID=A0A9W6ZMM3_9STRA|nr:hypothetical protein TrRE_jg7214 [Triparma retinervis]